LWKHHRTADNLIRGNAVKLVTTHGRQLNLGNLTRMQEPPTLHLVAPEGSSIYEIDFNQAAGQNNVITSCTFTSVYKSARQQKHARRIVSIGGRVVLFPKERISQVVFRYFEEDDAVCFGNSKDGVEATTFEMNDSSEYLVSVQAWRGDFTCRGKAIRFATNLGREYILVGPSSAEKVLATNPDFSFTAPAGSSIISLEWDADNEQLQSCLIGCFCNSR
jgi:hypothetical protein